MDLVHLISRRVWVWFAVLLATVGVLVWFVPAVQRANRNVPEHLQIGLQLDCSADRYAAPQYGRRDTVPTCAPTR